MLFFKASANVGILFIYYLAKIFFSVTRTF